MDLQKIGFGGGCHWCTEAYFQHLKGVQKVAQGWIQSTPPNDAFSEAVIVAYDPTVISLSVLIAIHLHTHSATKAHAFRTKYRSAVYVFDEHPLNDMQALIDANQPYFEAPILTQALPFVAFTENTENYLDYFRKNRTGAFCNTYILPRLQLLQADFAAYFRQI
ncbi:MAG: peptide methionine sulfoxide reductase [Sphingobacteriales bacterium]|nr:MAG: peptide methionine sulfoxide reductase [Sphingobacteriales bacterium]